MFCKCKETPLANKNQTKNPNKHATNTNYFLTVSHSSHLEQANTQQPELKQAEVPTAPTKIQVFKTTLKVEKGL